MQAIRPLFLAFCLVALCFVASPVRAQLPANELEGTWEMVSQRVIYPDSVVDRGTTLGHTIKVLNSTHFAFGRLMENSEDVYAGGGRYTLDGDRYVEHIEFHSAPGLSGTSIPFKVRVEGDLWYHTGEITDFTLEEVWRRVKPKPQM